MKEIFIERKIILIYLKDGNEKIYIFIYVLYKCLK